MSYDRKNSFLIFAPEYAQVTRSFTLVQKGEFFDAILDYVTFSFLPNFDEPMQKAFDYIKKRIDENMESYQKKCIKNKEIAIERERKKHERATKRKQSCQKRAPNDTDTDNDISSFHSDISLPIAERLINFVKEKKNIKIHASQKTAWANEIDLLNKVNGVSAERVLKAMDWYEVNHSGQYVPVIESGKSFRGKFTKLEDAMLRSSPAKSGDGFEYEGIIYYGKDAEFYRKLAGGANE